MNDRHKKHQHSTAHFCEKLGHKLISCMLSICEKRIHTNLSLQNRALTHAAMNVKHSIETFLLIVSLDDE